MCNQLFGQTKHRVATVAFTSNLHVLRACNIQLLNDASHRLLKSQMLYSPQSDHEIVQTVAREEDAQTHTSRKAHQTEACEQEGIALALALSPAIVLNLCKGQFTQVTLTLIRLSVHTITLNRYNVNILIKSRRATVVAYACIESLYYSCVCMHIRH